MGDERRRTKRIDVEANLSIRPITDQDTKENLLLFMQRMYQAAELHLKQKTFCHYILFMTCCLK